MYICFTYVYILGITISIPGAESQDSERRRQIALRALSERLSKVCLVLPGWLGWCGVCLWILSLDSVFGCSKLGVDLDPIVNIIINILGGGRKCDNQNYFYNIERKIVELIIPPSTAFLGDLNA